MSVRDGLAARLPVALALAALGFAILVALAVVVAVAALRRRAAVAAVLLLVVLLLLVLFLLLRLLVLEALRVLHLRERLEACEVRLHRALHEPQPGGHLLDHPRRLEVDGHHHARQVLGERVEADDAGVVRAADGLPGDPVVLAAVGDLRLPLALAEPDPLLP